MLREHLIKKNLGIWIWITGSLGVSPREGRAEARATSPATTHGLLRAVGTHGTPTSNPADYNSRRRRKATRGSCLSLVVQDTENESNILQHDGGGDGE